LRHPAAQGEWRLLECRPAWDGNWTWDCYIGFAWRGAGQTALIAVVNYAPNQSQCYLQIPVEQLNGTTIHFRDLMSSHEYKRDGDDVRARGLYLDMPAWNYHVFEMTAAG
jgi:hypothetical protein